MGIAGDEDRDGGSCSICGDSLLQDLPTGRGYRAAIPWKKNDESIWPGQCRTWLDRGGALWRPGEPP